MSWLSTHAEAILQNHGPTVEHNPLARKLFFLLHRNLVSARQRLSRKHMVAKSQRMAPDGPVPTETEVPVLLSCCPVVPAVLLPSPRVPCHGSLDFTTHTTGFASHRRNQFRSTIPIIFFLFLGSIYEPQSVEQIADLLLFALLTYLPR